LVPKGAEMVPDEEKLTSPAAESAQKSLDPASEYYSELASRILSHYNLTVTSSGDSPLNPPQFQSRDLLAGYKRHLENAIIMATVESKRHSIAIDLAKLQDLSGAFTHTEEVYFSAARGEPHLPIINALLLALSDDRHLNVIVAELLKTCFEALTLPTYSKAWGHVRQSLQQTTPPDSLLLLKEEPAAMQLAFDAVALINTGEFQSIYKTWTAMLNNHFNKSRVIEDEANSDLIKEARFNAILTNAILAVESNFLGEVTEEDYHLVSTSHDFLEALRKKELSRQSVFIYNTEVEPANLSSEAFNAIKHERLTDKHLLKQYYLTSVKRPELLTNLDCFSLSAKGTADEIREQHKRNWENSLKRKRSHPSAQRPPHIKESVY